MRYSTDRGVTEPIHQKYPDQIPVLRGFHANIVSINQFRTPSKLIQK